MAAVFALAPAIKAGMVLSVGGLITKAPKDVNVKLLGNKPDPTTDIFPPDRVKLGNNHKLEVIVAPENPKNALEMAESKPRAKVFFTAADNPLKPAVPLLDFGKVQGVGKLFKVNDSEGPQGGGVSGNDSNGSSPDPKDPKHDDYGLPAVLVGVGGAIYGLDRYLKNNDKPSGLGMFSSTVIGALAGGAGGIAVRALERPGMAILSGGVGAAAGWKDVSESADFRWVRNKGQYEFRDTPFLDKLGGSIIGGISAGALGVLNPWAGLGALAFSGSLLTDGYAGLRGVETRLERKNREYIEWANTPGMYGE